MMQQELLFYIFYYTFINLLICVYVYNYKSKAAIDDLGI